MEAVETFEHRGVTVEIHYDDHDSNPRENYDHMGTMVCSHRRYNLGDRQDIDDIASLIEQVEVNGFDQMAVMLPLYLYDHGGLSMSVGSFSHVDPGGWDSGMVGVIYVTRNTIIEEYGWDTPENREKAREVLEAEVKEYDHYLQGQVYGYVVDPDGECESCWGFIGWPDESGILDEAKSIAESIADEREAAEATRRNEQDSLVAAGMLPVNLWGE